MQKEKGTISVVPFFCSSYGVSYGTKAFGIGLSPLAPNVTIDEPAVVRLINQVFDDGRKTAVSNLPSPS